jgi:hypothetical protein
MKKRAKNLSKLVVGKRQSKGLLEEMVSEHRTE